MRTEVVIGIERIVSNIKKHFKAFVIAVVVGIVLSVVLAAIPRGNVNSENIAEQLKGMRILIHVKGENEHLTIEQREEARDMTQELVKMANAASVLEEVNTALVAAGYGKLTLTDEIACNSISAEMIELCAYSIGSGDRLLLIGNKATEVLLENAKSKYLSLSLEVVANPIVQNAKLVNSEYILLDSIYEEIGQNLSKNEEISFTSQLISKETVLIMMVAVIVGICYVVWQIFCDNCIYSKDDLKNYDGLKHIASLKNEENSLENASLLIANSIKRDDLKKVVLLKIGAPEYLGTDICNLVVSENAEWVINIKDDTDKDMLKTICDSDATVLVVKTGATDINAVERIVSMLEVVRTNVLGYILVD